MTAVDISFLQNRASYHNKVAEQYIKLYELCARNNLRPISGDILLEKQWQYYTANLKREYLPSASDGSIVLTKDVDPDKVLEGTAIAALRVHNKGFFCATLINGNHDMDIEELETTIQKILASL